MSSKMCGLIVKSPYVDHIVDGRKVWEIRGTRTRKRGTIALIKSGSGLIIGACDVVGVRGPLSLEELRRGVALWCGPEAVAKLPYRKTYAWVLCRAVRFQSPIPFDNPSGGARGAAGV